MIKLHKMTGGLAEFAPWCRSVQLWWATNHQAGPSKNRLCQRERKNIFGRSISSWHTLRIYVVLYFEGVSLIFFSFLNDALGLFGYLFQANFGQ